jgi:hypothetical protein
MCLLKIKSSFRLYKHMALLEGIYYLCLVIFIGTT